MASTTYVFSGFKSNRLPRACSRCARNDHKVVVIHHGRMTVNNKTFRDPIVVTDAHEGFCPTCYGEAREWLAASGATLAYDRRGRKPEWTPEMKAELAMLEESIHNFPYTDPFADKETLLSYKRQMNRLLLGIHA